MVFSAFLLLSPSRPAHGLSVLSIFFLIINSLFSPGNLYWEELYNAIDNPYVILTVRDDEHVWLNSWKNFARIFYNNGGVFSRRIMTFIMQSGMCGYRNRRFVSLGKSTSNGCSLDTVQVTCPGHVDHVRQPTGQQVPDPGPTK